MDANKKGQIWVETVIYTLIGLALIGIVLAIVTPKINASRDKIIVEQSIASLSSLDDKIKEVVDNGQGNVRKIPELTLKKGELTFDGQADTITIALNDISKPYSQPGIAVEVGSVFVLSEVQNSKTTVYLMLNYTNVINLTVSKADALKKYDPASVPYSFIISNEGGGGGVPFVVNIQEISDTGGAGTPLSAQCATSANCNSGGDCKTGSCTNGICSYTNKPDRTPCAGGTCNDAGQCITTPANPCAPNTLNSDGTCTAMITNVIRDGYVQYVSAYGLGYSDQSTSDTIVIGLNGIQQQKGYIQWNISSIPDNVQSINSISFKSRFKSVLYSYLRIKAMVFPLQEENKAEFFNMIGAPNNPIYNSGGEFTSGIDGDIKISSLNEHPNILSDFNATLLQDWFGITLDHTVPPDGANTGEIYASEKGGDYIPTLIVTYTP